METLVKSLSSVEIADVDGIFDE